MAEQYGANKPLRKVSKTDDEPLEKVSKAGEFYYG